MNSTHDQFIAHRRKDSLEQPLIDHLNEVSDITARLASKLSVIDGF